MPSSPKHVGLGGVPRVERAPGVFIQWPVTKEREGADEVLMGVIQLAAGSSGLSWDGKVDEIFYCVSGKLNVSFQESNGSRGEMSANQDEVLFLPRGSHYVMKAGGLNSAVFCKKA